MLPIEPGTYRIVNILCKKAIAVPNYDHWAIIGQQVHNESNQKVRYFFSPHNFVIDIYALVVRPTLGGGLSLQELSVWALHHYRQYRMVREGLFGTVSTNLEDFTAWRGNSCVSFGKYK